MSTVDPFRGVELLDFMRNEDRPTLNISHADDAATAKSPLLLAMPVDFDMFGPPELNTSYVPYPKNITRAPTWEITIKVC